MPTDVELKQIRTCLKKSRKIDENIWEFVRSSNENLAAFEAFLKTANIALIDAESSVIFEDGVCLKFLDSNNFNTKEVYQWVASNVKTVKFAHTAKHSKLLQSIMDMGSPHNVSLEYEDSGSANQSNFMLQYAGNMRSRNTSKIIQVAQPLVTRCFNSITTLEAPASNLSKLDFQGEILTLDLLKVVVEDYNQIKNVLQKKNIKTRRLEITLTTLKPKAFGADEMTWDNLVQAFTGVKNARLEAVESFKFTIDRYHVCGPLALRDFIQKCKTLFVNLKSMEVFREFIGFQATDTPKNMPVPKSKPKLYLELKEHLMNAEADLEINVSWNVLEFYSGPRFTAAIDAYRKILNDFTEDPESEMNIMMSKKENVTDNKTLYTEFYIMCGMDESFMTSGFGFNF